MFVVKIAFLEFIVILNNCFLVTKDPVFFRSGYNEIKEKEKDYNFPSERITSSCFAVARFGGFFACAGVNPWTTARSRSGRIYTSMRVLFHEGNNSREGLIHQGNNRSDLEI